LPSIWDRTYPAEDEIFAATKKQLVAWRKKLPAPAKMLEFHRLVATQAHDCLKALLEDRSGGQK